MPDTVTTFNLEYDNAERGLTAQINYWKAIASNLTLSDFKRSEAITVAATISQSRLDLAQEHYAKLTTAVQLGPPGDAVLQQATTLMRNLAAATAAAMQADALVSTIVGVLTALSQLKPQPAAELPAGAAAAPAEAVAISSVQAAALTKTVFSVAQRARTRIAGQS